MNPWQSAGKEWEALNADDPFEKEMKQSAKTLKSAIGHLDKATDYAAEAAKELKGTPMEDQVLSYLNELEDIMSDIKAIQENFAKGWRE